MKENRERERRYLLKRLPSSVEFHDILDIVQYYIKIDDITWRLRLSFSLIHEGQPEIEFLHKVFNGIGDFTEVIKEIDESEVPELIKKAHKVLKKTRFVHKVGDLKFEIDQPNNIDITFLEVELNDLNQEFEIPEAIKKVIIMEVTGIKELSNASLAETIQ